MLRKLLRRQRVTTSATLKLYNERTFYKSFEYDLVSSRNEVVIESPFLTMKRVSILLPHLRQAQMRGVAIVINTRDPIEHDEYMQQEAKQAIELLLKLEFTVLFTGKLHRKLAIIDRKILWEGSLNILSQNDSCELMQKSTSEYHVQQIMSFTGLDAFLLKN